MGEVTLTKLPATHGYDKKISFLMGEDTMTFYVRTSGNFIAARMDNWAFSIDLLTNTIRYETLGESTDRDTEESYVTRLRLLVNGVLDTTGAFESITSIEGLRLIGAGVEDTWNELITVKGTPSAMATNVYMQVPSFENDEGCTSTDCSAIERIEPTEAQIGTFHSQAAVDFTAHEANVGILAFDDVNLDANVTYSIKR